MNGSSDKQETLEDLRARIENLEIERSKRLKGELAVAVAKRRVDDELQRMTAIQEFVGQALKVEGVNNLTDLVLETIVEAFECETAAFLMFDDETQTFRVVASFDGEEPQDLLPCPEQLSAGQNCLLLQNDPELAGQWECLGLTNGMVSSFVDVDLNVVGAIVGGNTAEGEGIYTPLEDQHLSSFSVLVSQAASLRENLLLDQQVQAHIRELQVHQELLEQRVRERTAELHEERERLADALDVVNQSIRYAARIQRSTLSDWSVLDAFLAEYFVTWKPRDLVGGDMYWAKPWGDGLLLMLGDCTGHGVPGAFVTLLSSGALERAINSVEIGDLPALLNRSHGLLQTALGQDGDSGESDDGIELGACYLDPGNKRFLFSGARFELFIVDSGEVEIIRGAKKGMGYRNIPIDQTYPSQVIPITSEHTYYLTTDGLIDQVGGERRRMFGKKRFSKILLDIQPFPMAEQERRIYQALIDFQGDERRRDDVSIIGFKVS
jgi:serine phosphatase RsbU (regulator of sigma subunit)